MARIVVLSDIHLSPTHGFFWENWRIARDFANASRADAVIVNGDLCINGPDYETEIEFAATAINGLNGTVLVLPGNHDVGDEPPGQDAKQIINSERVERWQRAFGGDRWTFEAGGWWLIGLNAQLFGSDLAEEREQDAWLDRQLAAAAGRPIALFLHKPLFVDDPAEAEATHASLQPVPRRTLLEKLARSDVRLVVSGHVHQHRDKIIDGIRHIWLPAVAFTTSQPLGGDGRCGFAVMAFSADGASIELQYPPGLISHDLLAIKGHGRYEFLRDMPPCPPPLER